MRKRSKKRIPQDVIPWIRVRQEEDGGTAAIAAKVSTRWVSGNRRDIQNKLFSAQSKNDQSKILLGSFVKDVELSDVSAPFRSQLNYKLSRLNRNSRLYKPKNFCLYLGAGRTYNRKMLISRQTFRKLVRFGVIAGLQK